MLKTPIHLGSNWDVREEILRQEGDDAIQYAKKIAEDKEINYEGGFTEGNPTLSILGFVEQNKVNMITMGTLGKSGLEKFYLEV